MVGAAAKRSLSRETLIVSTLWLFLTLYAYSRILQSYPGGASMLVVVILHVIPPALFALIHGGMVYRLRDSVVFIFICFLVGNIFENLGVRTGYPFGSYYFTSVMGPKLGVVPIFLGLAYVGMAYLSWSLARVILGNRNGSLTNRQIVTMPLMAACIMVAWDLSMDPVWSTVLHAWIWKRGGIYFGVPVSNFLGWYIEVFLIYGLFAVYLRMQRTPAKQISVAFLRLPIFFYAISAAGNLILLLPRHKYAVVSDPAGVAWKLSSLLGACAFVSIFVMGGFAMFAWKQLAAGTPAAQSFVRNKIANRP